MDLRSYFDRIGFSGAAAPTLDVLRELHYRHIQAIPFENLDVLLGRRIDIAPEAVFAKLVTAKRGGYCFEQNTLFRAVLNEIGFENDVFVGRVRRNVPADVRTGLTHMILRVQAAGAPWLVDVGFGSLGSPAPVRLNVGETEQATPMEARRIVARGPSLFHQARLGAEWVDLYEFVPEAASAIDLELGNWYSCTHPKAHFMNSLVVTRVDGTTRLAIDNREFIERPLDGAATKSAIETPESLREVLASRFGIDLPPDTVIRAPAFAWP